MIDEIGFCEFRLIGNLSVDTGLKIKEKFFL